MRSIVRPSIRNTLPSTIIMLNSQRDPQPQTASAALAASKRKAAGDGETPAAKKAKPGDGNQQRPVSSRPGVGMGPSTLR